MLNDKIFQQKVLSIPFGQCFLTTLASLLIKRTEKPLDLAKTFIILPNHRSILGLQQAFQELLNTDTYLLLPQMISISDLALENPLHLKEIYELPPIITPLKRLNLLSQLILKFQKQYSDSQAFRCAETLIHFIDEIQTAGVDFQQLHNLVDSEYAEHWQITLTFLKILTDHWPLILKELNVIEASTYIYKSLSIISKYWLQNPLSHTVIIAGMTNTVPATQQLIKTVLALPLGQLILPGFDPLSSRIHHNFFHPQFSLQNLTNSLNLEAVNIPLIQNNTSLSKDRLNLIQSAMNNEEISLSSSFDSLHWPHMIECDSLEEEAELIALMMRYYLNQTEKTIALVTLNHDLSHLVQIELEKWGLVANASNGKPLSQTLIGSFIVAINKLWQQPTVNNFLIVLKHPLCFKHNNHQRITHLENVRLLEKNILRFWEKDIFSLSDTIMQKLPQILPWYKNIVSILAPLRVLSKTNFYPFSEILSYHKQICLDLTGDHSQTSPLWIESDGKASKDFFDTLYIEQKSFLPITIKSYTYLFNSLIQQAPYVYNEKGIGSQLIILTGLEIRLVKAEVIIVGGLNEKSWPASLKNDPWLSASMRIKIGLPPLEKAIGLSAHDFCGCLYTPQLLLTRSLNENGSLNLPSRFWQRLKVIQNKNNIQISDQKPWKKWLEQLKPNLTPLSIKISPPTPCPPVAARPKCLSVTQVERLMRDPYSVYAKYCLKLKPLPFIDDLSIKAEQGKIIHKAFEMFFKDRLIKKYNKEDFLKIARPLFTQNYLARTFWWQRFDRIAEWTIEKMKNYSILNHQVEQKGNFSWQYKNYTLTLTAVADRLDHLNDEELKIIDYKTGIPPTLNDMQNGYSPQLSLEALIAAHKGFENKTFPKSFEIWCLNGGKNDNKVITLPIDENFIRQTQNGLFNLMEAFLDENTPYLARPIIHKSPLYNDYKHLERLGEWMAC